jgi:hypothetical protein
LYVAGPDVPSEEMQDELRRLSRLEVRFRLITPENFRMLEREFLRPSKARAAAR